MEKLQWKMRNSISPKGLARVYVSCRPADFAPFFSSATDDMLCLQNCALWYLPPEGSVTDWDAHQSGLQQMDLLVEQCRAAWSILGVILLYYFSKRPIGSYTNAYAI